MIEGQKLVYLKIENIVFRVTGLEEQPGLQTDGRRSGIETVLTPVQCSDPD